MPTAIVVNDRGEALVGWAWGFSVAPNGWEDRFLVPVFGRRKVVVPGPRDLRPAGVPDGGPYVLNEPRVYSSARAASRAASRIRGHGRLAVVS